MKRKVIQIANSTQLISLPRKWAQDHNIKKGDELDLQVEGNNIVISTERGPQFSNIEVDITELDRTSILYCIESLYRLGYDKIKVNFNKPSTRYIRVNKEVSVLSVLHYVTSRLPGFEIIQQREKFCVINDIQEVSPKEFDSMMKRIFLLLVDAFEDLVQGIKDDNRVTIETVREKHDSITKFVSYLLRLINKVGHNDPKKNFVIYHVLADIDKVADVLKNTSRDYIKHNLKLKQEGCKLLEKISRSFKLYNELFYKFDVPKIQEISKIKEEIDQKIRSITKVNDKNELLFLSDMKASLEILTGLTEARWALEY